MFGGCSVKKIVVKTFC